MKPEVFMHEHAKFHIINPDQLTRVGLRYYVVFNTQYTSHTEHLSNASCLLLG